MYNALTEKDFKMKELEDEIKYIQFEYNQKLNEIANNERQIRLLNDDLLRLQQ